DVFNDQHVCHDILLLRCFLGVPASNMLRFFTSTSVPIRNALSQKLEWPLCRSKVWRASFFVQRVDNDEQKGKDHVEALNK
ncbi:hypothetical protein MOC63_20500, partial [Bacillus paralicheniformis]|uniref:hypothetical protein n=2 Tax=Bacillus paralicheniformis TaxID=1648923 RepID=UPI00227E5291